MAGESRAAMVAAAASLFRAQGFDATSWRQVIAESGAPAGSVGYLFPDGKSQLAVEVVAKSGAETGELMAAVLATHDDPIEAIRAWILASAAVLEASDFVDGCPIATTALELSHRDEQVRLEIESTFASWTTILADRLEPTYGPDHAATIAQVGLAAFEGSLLVAKAQRSTAPLLTLADNLDGLIGGLVAST